MRIQLLFPLLQALKKRYRSCLLGVEETYRLTDNELDILLFLANNPGYDTARDIVEIRQLTKSHVSMSLKHLLQTGYVRLEGDGRDRRIVHIRLEPKAERVVKEGRSAQMAFEALLLDGVEDKDLECFFRVVEQMRRSAEALG